MNNNNSSLQLFNESNLNNCHIYQKDIEIPHLYYPEPIPTIVTFFYAILLSIGITGNLLVIFIVLSNRRIRSKTNVYLCNLAISDLILLIVGVSYDIIQTWGPYKPLGGNWFCFMHGLCTETVTDVSVLTITLLTVERFLAIFKRPFELPLPFNCKRVVSLISIVWIVSVIAAVPHAIQYTLVPVPVCENASSEILWCDSNQNNGKLLVNCNSTTIEYGRCDIASKDRIRYMDEIVSLLGFFLPMACIGFGYGFIIRLIYRSFGRRISDTPLIVQPREVYERKRQIGMLCKYF